MPGRTLASFYGNNGETSESPQQSSREPFYPSPGQEQGQTGTPHQYDASYYYPNVNQPTGYPSAQYVAPYSYSAPSQSSRHDSMSYPNSQGAYNASAGHYASPGHGQSASGYAGGGQWPPQQAEFAAPAPAHAAGQHALPGQFQRNRLPPVVGSPPVQHPAWTHTPPQAVAGGALAPSGYYPVAPQLAHRPSVDRQAWKPAHQANGNPLFSLQMLVNQDHSRAQQAQQVNNYESSETVDLSSTASPTSRATNRDRNGRVSVPTPPLNGSPSAVASSRPKSEPSSLSRLEPPTGASDRKTEAAAAKVETVVEPARRESDSVVKAEPVAGCSKTKATSPEGGKSKVGTPESPKPKVGTPESPKPKVGTPESAKPKVTTPEISKPKAVEAERSKTPEKSKKAKKVDSLLESLVAKKESPAEARDEAGDDDKPRRKRKLDKPVRVAKTPGTEEPAVRRRSTSEGSEPVPPPPPPADHDSAAKRQRRKSESDQVTVKDEPQSSPVVAPSETESKNNFIEVESELEKMFAGMEEVAAPTVVKTESPKTPKAPKRRSRAKTDAEKSASKKASGKRKGKRTEPMEEMSKGLDSGSNASGCKIKGPLVRIDGDNVTVCNGPTQTEAEMPRPVPIGRRKQAASVYQSDLDYRAEGKLSASMFTSTLSAHYDAQTTDRAWLCVFCKAGPHSNTGQRGPANGDLFGPYLVPSRDRDVTDTDDRDLNAEQKRGGRNKKSLRKTDTLEQFRKKMSKKAKKAAAAAEAAQPTGMLARGNGCFEVWTHESCALWAAGTRVVGSRVYGLQEAVWAAISSTCHKCTNSGATVSCAARSCTWRLHVDCAFVLGWELDEDSFLARCPVHRIKQEPGTSKG